MNIYFDKTENQSVNTHSNAGRETTSYRSSEGTQKVQQNGFALDISGTVMDNSAYAGHGRTAEEVMQEAGQQDITARRNYMAVMSNSMSDEDFAKLQKDGFHPGSTDIETVVTIVDHIKTALLKGGTDIAGYTDTLSGDKLQDITGSQVFARELQKQFEAYDIPMTQENIEAVNTAWKTMEEVTDLSEGTVKYMIENDMEPTPENLYRARFSAAEDGSRQGKGYYRAGEVSGYYAKKPESIDYEKLMPQIENVIQEAGFSVNEENKEAAKWLIEKGIPLNTETFRKLKEIREIHLPETKEEFVQAAAIAISEGKNPAKADITKTESVREEAVSIKEKTDALGEEAVDMALERKLPLTLKNLFALWESYGQTTKKDNFAEAQSGSQAELSQEAMAGRRLLEEIRLSMTVSANLKLLRSGFQIETAPMERLIESLKKAESAYEQILAGETETTAAREKTQHYSRTLYLLESIKKSPADILNQISETDTLVEIEALGKARAAYYEKAESAYETLMTEPRKDMGDSIQKAFRNIDEILKGMDLEISEENRKAVRILGYNSMEITEENLNQVKQAEALLTGVVNKMNPATVLSMIREGINPAEMPLEELERYLEEQADPAQEIESYSRFLYKLEQSSSITEEERSAYIGIYRLMRQIEKEDDAAVGAALQTGVSQTLDHLLTAVRSSKKKQMDYRIDDSFGGVSPKETGIDSITAQIEKGYMKTREQLEEALSKELSEGAEKEFDRYLYQEVRNAMKTEEGVLRQLLQYSQPVTPDYLMAAEGLLYRSGEVFKRLQDLKKDRNEEQVDSEKDFDFAEALENEKTAEEAYEAYAEKMQSAVENAAFSTESKAVDIKAMSSLYKQIRFMRSMAREENYEMPVEINGVITAVNLKMIHAKEADSKVAITMETPLLGKTAAEFSFQEGKLGGYSVSEKEEGRKLLSENQEKLMQYLEKEELKAGDIHFITNRNLDLTEFSIKEVNGMEKGRAAGEFYRAARAFIGYLQDISTEKGMTTHENQL